MSGLHSTVREAMMRDNKAQIWILENSQYITMMGSHAYDTFTEQSDYDLYGFTIPPKDIVFPFHYGYIYGFSKDIPKFEQYQKHGMQYKKKDIDLQIFNIVKYFQLLMDNNPNMVDSLFTKIEYVIKCTKIAEMVRINRKTFLHKGSYHRFKGYAYSQLKKVKSMNRTGKRKAIVEKYGYDTKFAGHIVRLLDEAEQILQEGDIDITRAKEQIKAVNRGEFTLEQIEQKFHEKEKYLTELYEKSKLRHRPDQEAIKELLLHCLEEYYGNIDNLVRRTANNKADLIRDIEKTLERYR